MDMDLESGIGPHPEKRLDTAAHSTRLKDTVHQFSETVCVVGLRQAVDAKSSRGRRLVWILLLLVGLGLAFYQIQDCVMYYSRSPYTTEFEMVNAQKLRLPQITLCNEFRMIKSKAKKLGIYDHMAKISQVTQDLDPYDTEELDSPDSLRESMSKINEATQDWERVSEQLAQSVTEAVKSFKWSGEHENLKKVTRIKTDMGYCFAFSSVNHSLISTSPGMKYGLQLELDAQILEYFPTVQYDNAMAGFRILIHDPLEVPRMLDAGFTASPGNVFRIAVSLENISYPGPPHSNCVSDPDYRTANCVAKCDDNDYARICGCKPYYAQGNVRVCDFLEQDECDSEMNHLKKEDPAVAACNCPQQCNRSIYKLFISQSQLARNNFHTWNINETTDPSQRSTVQKSTDSSTIMLHVYYQHLTYMQIDSVPAYSFFMLLCDVGGALSLLLGATLLTVYEVLEFTVQVARDYYVSRRLRK